MTYTHNCKTCGAEFTSGGPNAKWCPSCRDEMRAASVLTARKKDMIRRGGEERVCATPDCGKKFVTMIGHQNCLEHRTVVTRRHTHSKEVQRALARGLKRKDVPVIAGAKLGMLSTAKFERALEMVLQGKADVI